MIKKPDILQEPIWNNRHFIKFNKFVFRLLYDIRVIYVVRFINLLITCTILEKKYKKPCRNANVTCFESKISQLLLLRILMYSLFIESLK